MTTEKIVQRIEAITADIERNEGRRSRIIKKIAELRADLGEAKAELAAAQEKAAE